MIRVRRPGWSTGFPSPICMVARSFASHPSSCSSAWGPPRSSAPHPSTPLPRSPGSQRTSEIHRGRNRTARARRRPERRGTSPGTRPPVPPRRSARPRPRAGTEQHPDSYAPLTIEPHALGSASGSRAPTRRVGREVLPLLCPARGGEMRSISSHHPPLHRKAHPAPSRPAASASPHVPRPGSSPGRTRLRSVSAP